MDYVRNDPRPRLCIRPHSQFTRHISPHSRHDHMLLDVFGRDADYGSHYRQHLRSQYRPLEHEVIESNPFPNQPDHYRASLWDLCNFALVHPVWTQEAQRAMLHVVYISKDEGCNRFTNGLDLLPRNIIGNVKRLVANHQIYEHPASQSIADLVKRCPRVRDLVLSRLTCKRLPQPLLDAILSCASLESFFIDRDSVYDLVKGPIYWDADGNLVHERFTRTNGLLRILEMPTMRRLALGGVAMEPWPTSCPMLAPTARLVCMSLYRVYIDDATLAMLLQAISGSLVRLDIDQLNDRGNWSKQVPHMPNVPHTDAGLIHAIPFVASTLRRLRFIRGALFDDAAPPCLSPALLRLCPNLDHVEVCEHRLTYNERIYSELSQTQVNNLYIDNCFSVGDRNNGPIEFITSIRMGLQAKPLAHLRQLRLFSCRKPYSPSRELEQRWQHELSALKGQMSQRGGALTFIPRQIGGRMDEWDAE